MSESKPYPDAFMSVADFDALARGEPSADTLARLRQRVQAALDDPDDGVDHDTLWTRLEERMKRARSRAA